MQGARARSRGVEDSRSTARDSSSGGFDEHERRIRRVEEQRSTNEGFEESRSRGARTKDSRSQEAEELVRRIQAVEKAHGSRAL